MIKLKCKTHNITLTEEGNVRKLEGLSWAGVPRCILFTLSELKPGKYDSCIVEVL